MHGLRASLMEKLRARMAKKHDHRTGLRERVIDNETYRDIREAYSTSASEEDVEIEFEYSYRPTDERIENKPSSVALGTYAMERGNGRHELLTNLIKRNLREGRESSVDDILDDIAEENERDIVGMGMGMSSYVDISGNGCGYVNMPGSGLGRRLAMGMRKSHVKEIHEFKK
ncbi:hypothetical protein KY345_02020 [Candidatus Woesearchaeota archaeon]|nr:hypothetical protein [Candidatus Woesearchaeota archaeon]